MIAEPKTTFAKQFEQQDQWRRAPGLQAVRQTGRSRFGALSFPTPRTEDWRFTNVAPLIDASFELVDAAVTVASALLPPLSAPNAIRLTFVNGWFAAGLSNLTNLPAGLAVGSLAAAAPEALRPLAQLADSDSQIFTALNTALLHDGAYVSVAAGTVIDRPIEILCLANAAGRKLAMQPRLLLVADQGSQVTLVERFVGLGDQASTYFTNAVSEIAVGANAVVDHYKVQQESSAAYHVANTQVVLDRAANFTSHAILLGGSLVRNEVRVRFDGENAEATVNGLYLAAGKQHIDNFTVIDHAVPNCASHELYKGVLADQAHGVFNGKIFVRKDAQKTDAKQTNKVLLLSDGATINTKPQLEIFADDVKCTHGATIGQLDADQTFYLQSRGIPAQQARRLLTFAFANDIVNRIKVATIREELEAILVNRNL